MEEGASIIDIGAYSTRPGAADISAEEEMERLALALQTVRRTAPQAIISIDTFRADVARRCVEEYGAHIINDISGGELDKDMFRTMAELNVPYILTHMRGNPQTMQQEATYQDVAKEVIVHLGHRLEQLREMGVCDVILDPGFGFAKTLDHNYELMAHLQAFKVLQAPLLVGVSRKSMVYRLLECTPQEALNGTTALHTIALLKGANILRVHDVKAAAEAISIVKETLKYDGGGIGTTK
jgi:dihydropteroate synthase